ncbi:unnamed protein product [Brachionus calyciflorus]|uniref:Uncharacterized protein n=1 Tax=Brachionus calyciflorus TaxID=104777 RepID=A0A813QM00_9BILA|nr:unnamed protein product [Brachionus calyciflorus]
MDKKLAKIDEEIPETTKYVPLLNNTDCDGSIYNSIVSEEDTIFDRYLIDISEEQNLPKIKLPSSQSLDNISDTQNSRKVHFDVIEKSKEIKNSDSMKPNIIYDLEINKIQNCNQNSKFGSTDLIRKDSLIIQPIQDKNILSKIKKEFVSRCYNRANRPELWKPERYRRCEIKCECCSLM